VREGEQEKRREKRKGERKRACQEREMAMESRFPSLGGRAEMSNCPIM